MSITLVPAFENAAQAVAAPVPANEISPEAEMIISAMEAGGNRFENRRTLKRLSWRVQATVRLFVDALNHPARVVYTRDVHSRGLGFVTPERLPLGYGGVIDLPAKDGSIVSVACTVLRCRQTSPGWYEGMVYFNREQTTIDRLVG
jgi:hypothetical protein